MLFFVACWSLALRLLELLGIQWAAEERRRKDELRKRPAPDRLGSVGSLQNAFLVDSVPFPHLQTSTKGDEEWWRTTVARVHQVDFVPDAPPSVEVQPPPDLFEKMEHVVAAAASAAREGLHEPIDEIWATRALIATDFNADAAATLATAYVRWRSDLSGLTLPDKSVVDKAIVIVPFTDRFGRPVAISRLRYVEPGKLDLMTNHYRSVWDGIIAHLTLGRQADVSRTNPLDQAVCCVDCEGMSFKNASMEYARMFLREGSERYLERTSVMYILNPPFIFHTAFAMVEPLLHPRTKRKIQLVKKADVPRLMRGLVGEDRADSVLPPKFGGSAAPFPPPGEGRTLDEKVGAVLASTWCALGATTQGDAQWNEGPVQQTEPGRRRRGPHCFSCFAGTFGSAKH
jgi:hypothetical protein